MRQSEFLFTADETLQFEQSLGELDPFLSELAQKHRMRALRQASKGWPGRMLRTRRWLKTYTLQITLNPAFADSDGPSSPRWDLTDVWMYDYGELIRRTIEFRTLATSVGAEELSSAAMRALIARAVEENISYSWR